MNADWRNRSDVAIDAAIRAGKLAMSYYENAVAVEWKGDKSPVTVADRNAEMLIRGIVAKEFPDDGFLGEEFGTTESKSGYRWIIDPIDGTRSFVRGVPIWATLIGVEYNGEQIIGVCYVPPADQTYHAIKGNGAYRDAKRIRVSDVSTMSESLLAYSSLNWFIREGRLDDFLRLYSATQRQRGYGDFYGFVLVAQGACDLMVEHGVNAWDVAATKVIVEEAGGMFSDWDGVPTIHRPDVIASNGKLHEAALSLLRPQK